MTDERNRLLKTSVIAVACITAAVLACRGLSTKWNASDAASHVASLGMSQTLATLAIASIGVFLRLRWRVSGRGRERRHALFALLLVAPLSMAAMGSTMVYYEGDVSSFDQADSASDVVYLGYAEPP